MSSVCPSRYRSGSRSQFVLSTALAVAALALLSPVATGQTVITQWNFNGSNFTPSTGSGTAVVLGATATIFVGTDNVGAGTLAGGSSDPGTDVNDDLFNFVPRISNFPSASGTGGMRFSGINAAGVTNGFISFDLAAVDIASEAPTTSASRWYQVRYSTDGGSNYNNLSGPIEYQRTGTGDATLWANQTVLSLAGIEPTADLRFEIVAIHAPGTSSFAPASSLPYSPAAPVAFDMVTVFQGKTWSSTAGSDNLQDGTRWSGGTAPVAGELSSHVVFGGNSNAAVTVTNTTNLFQLQSISFSTEADSTAYTITGQQINLGDSGAAGGVTGFAGLTTITNASNREQTISSPLILSRGQRWDSGSRAGGSLRFTSQVGLSPGVNLEFAGANPMNLEGDLTLIGSNTVTVNMSNGAAVTLSAAGTGNLFGNNSFIVKSGSLNVTNPTGSATADAGILVNAGGRLTGHGRVAPSGVGKTVTIASGGVISAGTSAANRVLTIASNGLTVQGGKVELNLFGTGATDSGRLDVTGAVSSTSGILDIALLNGVTPGSLRDAVFAAGGTRTYTVITASAASSYNFTLGNFASQGLNPSEWSISTSGNSLQLTFAPVPEPSTILALAAGALVLTRSVRRRLAPGTCA